MTTRLHPGPACPCLAPECRRARRAENVRAVWLSAVALAVIFMSLWAVELIGVQP